MRVLLIAGSLRAASTNLAVLRTVQAIAPDGVDGELYARLGDLPHFNADLDRSPLPQSVVQLRDAIHRADALLFCTPEYAGALPGSFKNLLDWTIGDDQARSIYEKPTAWINASSRDAEHAHASLRLVLQYAHADIVDEACVHVPVSGADVGEDGLVTPPALRDAIGTSVDRLVERARTSGKLDG